MKVKELIAALQTMPQEAETIALYDGYFTVLLEQTYIANNGKVVMTDDVEYVMDDEKRPINGGTVVNAKTKHVIGDEVWLCNCKDVQPHTPNVGNLRLNGEV